jgi:uncharacterized membrane protein YfcA
MHLDLTDLALIATAFAASLASGLAGFAFALVANGAFLQILPPTTAVPVVLAGSLIAQLFSVFALREAISWPRLWPFLLGGTIGIPLGAWALLAIDPTAFKIVVGLFLVAYSVYALLAHPPTIRGGGRLADGAIGWVGGVMGGLAALSGAVPTVWCQLRGWPKVEQRGVYQPYIVVMQALGLAALYAGGAIDRATVPVMVLTLPAILVGTFAGLRLYARVNDRQFRLIVLLLLFASGTALLLPHAAAAFR